MRWTASSRVLTFESALEAVGMPQLTDPRVTRHRAAAQPALTHGTATSGDGVPLHFSLYLGARSDSAGQGIGQRPRVTLIHSFALDGSIWDGLVRQIAPAADVLVVDLRGHGKSGLGDPSHFTLGQLAEDLTRVLDQAEWDATVLAGCSMGGCIALQFGVSHPDRITGLALASTTAYYGSTGAAFWSGMADRGRAEGLAALAPQLAARWFTDEFRTAQPETVKQLADVFAETDPRTFEASCRMLGEMDLRLIVGGIQAPTTILVGSNDLATTPAMAAELSELIADASVTELTGMRHLFPIERPDVLAELLTRAAGRA